MVHSLSGGEKIVFSLFYDENIVLSLFGVENIVLNLFGDENTVLNLFGDACPSLTWKREKKINLLQHMSQSTKHLVCEWGFAS